ncbi:MAG: hypothetical protein LBT89_11340, partial [Planctomycetaceae bacterium]|nr:hypothetical protein [Planctomycetaceae bacterium]
SNYKLKKRHLASFSFLLDDTDKYAHYYCGRYENAGPAPVPRIPPFKRQKESKNDNRSNYHY